jgi:hypothetical protein
MEPVTTSIVAALVAQAPPIGATWRVPRGGLADIKRAATERRLTKNAF